MSGWEVPPPPPPPQQEGYTNNLHSMSPPVAAGPPLPPRVATLSRGSAVPESNFSSFGGQAAPPLPSWTETQGTQAPQPQYAYNVASWSPPKPERPGMIHMNSYKAPTGSQAASLVPGPHQQVSSGTAATGGDIVFSSQTEPVFSGGTHMLQFPSTQSRRVSLSSPGPGDTTGAGAGAGTGTRLVSSIAAGEQVPLTAKVASLVPKSFKVDLSEDIQWKHTKSGQPYVVCSLSGAEIRSEIDSLIDPSQEHVVSHNFNLFTSHRVIAQFYGEQVKQYFNFVWFVMLTNLVFTCIALISFVPHARDMVPRLNAERVGTTSDTSIGGVAVLNLWFISTYQPSSDTNWTVMVVLATVVSFLVPFLYMLLVAKYFKDDMNMQYAGLSSTDADLIPENRPTQNNPGLTDSQRFVRLVISYCLYFLCLAIPIVIMWAILFVWLHQYIEQDYDSRIKQNSASMEWRETLIPAIVSLIPTLSNAIFELVVEQLTIAEKHRYYSRFRFHRIIKKIGFRILNIMGLFALRFYADSPWYTCTSSRIGYQVLLFILIDITFNNILEVFIPFFMRLFTWMFCGSVDSLSDEEKKPDFELTDEYFEIIFRQYIMYMSISVFPMITFITLISNIIEYPLDKYRLLYVCRRPRGYMSGGRKTIAAFFFAAAFFALITFPSGPVWFSAPLGPYMCWPCDKYSQIRSSNGGTCLPSFEELKCYDNAGQDLPEYTIRQKIFELKSSDSTVQKAADAWFGTNSHLFTDRRCGCRPCVAAISCPCSSPVLRTECSAITNQGSLEFKQGQCDKPRQSYSAIASKSHTSTCRNSTQACTAHEQCASKLCDTYCPVPPKAKEGQWPVVEQCWNCAETATNGLVNPRDARKTWTSVNFCQKCLGPSCICNKDCDYSVPVIGGPPVP